MHLSLRVREFAKGFDSSKTIPNSFLLFFLVFCRVWHCACRRKNLVERLLGAFWHLRMNESFHAWRDIPVELFVTRDGALPEKADVTIIRADYPAMKGTIHSKILNCFSAFSS
jgi:hypothetical protein